MGGTTVKTPGPSAAETALRQEQAETLRFQREVIQSQIEQQELLAPILFKQLGVKPQLDEAGEIIGFTEIEDPTAALQEEIELALLERSKAALAGELPENPALLRDLRNEEEVLREGLRKQLGADFETSSPGIEKLGDFFERREILLEASRRGDLTTAEALSLGREQVSNQSLQAFLAGNQSVLGGPLQGASQLGQVAAGFGGASQLFQGDRALRLQARTATAGNKAGQTGALIGAGGGVAAAGVAAVIL
jgi:hypothetical protein